MKLSELATKPQLIKITIDKEELVKKYGDSLEFYIWDRQPLNVFGRLASAEKENFQDIAELMNTLILDENGKTICEDGFQLPFDVMVEAMSKISENLGK